ncbi:MAG: hypothetical protein RR983_19685, partial [Massilia sp.]
MQSLLDATGGVVQCQSAPAVAFQMRQLAQPGARAGNRVLRVDIVRMVGQHRQLERERLLEAVLRISPAAAPHR